ncbi:MAG TPA: outer membrane beta-barrel protein [Nitrospira sp.]|nr:outer membrane beta-barrel protein [Nitrospira sp.]
MIQIARWVTGVLTCVAWMITTPVLAESVGPNAQDQERKHPASEDVQQPGPEWHYGGFVDLGYSLNFNFPENHLFRNRGTTPRVNELDLNMAGVYIRKDATVHSRWGTEWLVHGGQDAKNFPFHANQPKVGSSDQLRHFGRANASYLAPVGNGITIQAGLFNSLIGYDSLYAKDNNHYTRAWIADYSPYLMFGVNASYSFNEQLTGTLYVINSYFHLSHPNDQPSYGGQLVYKPSSQWTVKEAIYWGPEQANTSLEFWRLFFDTIVEWKGENLTIAFENQVGTENLAVPGSPRTFWIGAILPVRWNFNGPWSVAVRPEFFWDRNGRLTGFEQFIKAVTTTLEYRFPYGWTNLISRLEYRYDESTGPGGGFFKGNEIAPGVVGLTPAQHMLIFGLIWTLDSP